MIAPAPSLHYSYAEYVRFEDGAKEKHEYVHGLILAMAGGTLEHSALCSAVIIALGGALAGRACRVFESNARIRVRSSGNAYYPDASVVCGPVETAEEDPHALTNPQVLVEVLSATTEAYDTTDKLTDYQTIPGLLQIVHLAQTSPRVDVWTRHDDTWTKESFVAGQSAILAKLNVTLDVSELYRDPLADASKATPPPHL